MKDHPCRLRRGFAFLLLSLLPLSARADVLALDFVGGGSTANSVTNSVDAYTGMAGDGWLKAWATPANSGTTRGAEVLSANPLATGKNYLQFTANKTVGGTSSAGISRQYDAASVGAEQIISFQFRLDSDPAQLDRIRFFDANASQTSQTGAFWFIRADSGGNWTVYNGGSSIDTGISLTQNSIYNFSIHVFSDKTYIVSINEYTSVRLNPYTSDTDIGGYLNFLLMPVAGTVENPTTVTGSFGSISVEPIPEPGRVALLGAAALAFAGRRFWKMRRTLAAKE